VLARYGNYGTPGFAEITEYSTSHCHLSTGVQIDVWVNGYGPDTSGLCQNWGRLSNPSPGTCAYEWSLTRAVRNGNALGMWVRLCVGSGVQPDSCEATNLSWLN